MAFRLAEVFTMNMVVNQLTLFSMAYTPVQTADDDNWFFYFDSHCTILCIAVDRAYVWHFRIASIYNWQSISFWVQLSSHNRSSDYYQQNSISTLILMEFESFVYVVFCVYAFVYYVELGCWWFLYWKICSKQTMDITIVIVSCCVEFFLVWQLY